MRHSLVHLLGCLLPLLVIFLLPFFGLGGGAALFVVIVLMFACHLFMMRGHAHGDLPPQNWANRYESPVDLRGRSGGFSFMKRQSSFGRGDHFQPT